MRYRGDIDGLRAIAVLAVILFHASDDLVPGGYLGVDIFFVISGYLITALLLRDLARNGQISLAQFYERRARRILPALLLVVAATLPFAALWLLPSRQTDYALSVVAIMAFASNVLFWLRTGYFMPAAEEEPLLHTWSLAVEEQFYVLFPLLLWLVWRFAPQARLAVLLAVAAISLGASEYLSRHAPSANFYLLPSRAWELLAGAILALVLFQRQRQHHSPAEPASVPISRQLLAATGLIFVTGSLAVLDESYPMPSLWALFPVLGAVLIIATAEGTLTGRLLGLAVPRGIGLISYSAYLWHWPILVFARLRFGDALSLASLAAVIAATLALAWLSYVLVETPFRRRGPHAPVQLRLLVASGVAAIIALPVTAEMIRHLPEPKRAAFTPAEIEAKVATNYGLSELCEGAFTLDAACRTSETPELMIWGDSFAMHLVPAFLPLVESGLVQMTKSVCIPAVGISVVTPEYPASWAEGCIAFNDQVLDWLETQPSIETVVVSSPFGLIFNDVYERGGGIAVAPRPDLVAEALRATAYRVRAMGKRFVVVSPPPVTGEDIGQCLVRAALAGGPEDACDFPATAVHRLSRLVLNFLADLDPEVPVVFLEPLICDGGVCDTRIGETFLFRDAGHLSVEGARLLGQRHDLYDLVLRAGGG